MAALAWKRLKVPPTVVIIQQYDGPYWKWMLNGDEQSQSENLDDILKEISQALTN